MELTLKQKISLIKFQGTYEPQNYDIALAKDSSKWEDLIRLVRTHYEKGYEEDFWVKYQALITTAIESSNILGLEVLWKGIYHHDRSNPDFVTDVYTAVEYANLDTLLHVLYGYMNYMDLNPKENLEYTKLKDLAARNPNDRIVGFIVDIGVCLNSKNEIRPWDRSYIKGKVFSEKKDHVRGRMYYTVVKRYSKKC
jgi:hypothetical protein